jgi:starch synthase (maltosyl-transferring)
MTDEIVSTGGKPGERSAFSEQALSVPSLTEPTRIAFCITDLDVGGAERMLVELVTRLDRHLWEPRVYCLSVPGKLVERLNETNIPVVCFGVQSVRQIGVVWKLARELRSFRPDLIQCFLFHANLIGRLAAFLAGVRRVVCGIRVAERRSRIRLWLDKLTQAFVDHNVCVSRAVADFSTGAGKLNARKVSVIPNAVDSKMFASVEPINRLTLGIATDVPVAIFVGRLDPQKAPFILLDAFKRLFARHPNWHLLIVGHGVLLGSLQQWVAENDLGQCIHLLGWRPDVPQLLKTADCLVLPSLWEGMPNIVLEAMAAGLPVVVTQVEGTAELILSGETGLLVKPGSVESVERAVETILCDPQLSKRLADNAQQLVNKRFTFEAMVAAYDQLYGDLTSSLGGCSR